MIVNDDLDMPVGQIRLKTHGASGGHNGLKSIINALVLSSLTGLNSVSTTPAWDGSWPRPASLPRRNGPSSMRLLYRRARLGTG
ncbi:MAG: hypothetical protein ACLSH6_09745 [Limosilactobacillus pontis]